MIRPPRFRLAFHQIFGAPNAVGLNLPPPSQNDRFRMTELSIRARFIALDSEKTAFNVVDVSPLSVGSFDLLLPRLLSLPPFQAFLATYGIALISAAPPLPFVGFFFPPLKVVSRLLVALFLCQVFFLESGAAFSNFRW